MFNTATNILEKLRAGDQEAFTWFYNTYSPIAYKEAYYHLRDRDISFDIVQNVFLYFWTNHTRIAEIRSLDGYIAASAKGKALELLRAQERRRQRTDKYLAITKYDHLPDIDFTKQEDNIKQLLRGLPTKEKKIFYMSKFEFHSHGEIADVLKVSRSRVGNSICRTYRRLEELFGIKVKGKRKKRKEISSKGRIEITEEASRKLYKDILQ